MLVPSIDIMNGKLVQLKQGKDKVIEFDNPIDFAKKYSIYTSIQLIDLDSAMDKGDNNDLIKQICNICRCRVGGGIRSLEKAKDLIASGADKIIIGTMANVEFLSQLCQEVGREKIIVALDARNREISIRGWKEQTGRNLFVIAKELEDYCSEFLYTCIEKEGLMNGVDFETVKQLKKITSNKISFAGGISSIEEINEFDKINVNSIVGMAIYSGKINPAEAFIDSLDFSKSAGLIPTIVKDEQGNVLTLAYSNRESLLKALEMRIGAYFSRNRGKLWIKGETSGNIQELIEIKTDCDRDALIFVVKQKGNACHLNQYSCFQEKKKFDLEALYNKIKSKMDSYDENSYTKKLVADKELLKRKLIEEAAEVITAKNKKELIWECSDLIYFLLVIMAEAGVIIKDIERENERRDKK